MGFADADDGSDIHGQYHLPAARPAAAADLNNEGFAIAPQAECKDGVKPTFYADDTNDDTHALRTGMINCTVLKSDPAPQPSVTSTPTVTPTPQVVMPTAQADRTAPKLKLSLKVKRSGGSNEWPKTYSGSPTS